MENLISYFLPGSPDTPTLFVYLLHSIFLCLMLIISLSDSTTSFCGHLMYIYRNMTKSAEMKHEMTLFHTMGPHRNVLFQTHLLFATIYGLTWNSFNIR